MNDRLTRKKLLNKSTSMSLNLPRSQRHRAISKSDPLNAKSTKKAATPIALGILAAAVAPGAYLVGFYYYQGYLAGFGIAADNFPISAPDVYIYSYLAIGRLLLAIVDGVTKLLDAGLSRPTLYWVIGALASATTLVYWIRRPRKRSPSRYRHYLLRTLRSFSQYLHPKNNAFTWAMGLNLILFYLICTLLAVFVYIVFFWWLFPWAAYYGGKDRANDEMIKFLAQGCQLEEKIKWNTCSVILNGKNEVEHEGLFIVSNDKLLAFFNRDGSYVIPRKETQIIRKRFEANDK